jgi:hypothetical protein
MSGEVERPVRPKNAGVNTQPPDEIAAAAGYRGGPRDHGYNSPYGHSAARKAGELDPEWAMAGVDVPAGKRLYASRDLKGSAFAVAVDENWNGDGWHLTTTMCRMLVITKPTYAECLAELMTIWQNWDAGAAAVHGEVTGRKAIRAQ